MSSFFLALLAVALVGLGGRDQLLVARLGAQMGQSAGLLAIGSLVSILTACVMATAGSAMAGMLSVSAKTMLLAFALLAAALDCAWPRKQARLREPTRSLGAIAIVLIFRQFTDAARFLVFALAVGLPSVWLAAAGGAIGGIVALGMAFAMGADFERQVPLRALRLTLSALLGMAALFVGLSARGIV